MQSRVPSAEHSEVAVLKEGINALAEAWLEAEEPKRRRRFLKALGARLNVNRRPGVTGINEVAPRSPVATEMRLWLLERLSVWVGRYER